MASIIKFTLYFHRPSFLSHDKILKWNSSSSPHLPHLLLPLLLLLHHLLFLFFLCFILFTVEREREREKDVLYKIWQGRFLSWDDRRRLQNVSHSVGRVSGGFKPLFLRRPYGPTDILQEGICVLCRPSAWRPNRRWFVVQRNKTPVVSDSATYSSPLGLNLNTASNGTWLCLCDIHIIN